MVSVFFYEISREHLSFMKTLLDIKFNPSVSLCGEDGGVIVMDREREMKGVWKRDEVSLEERWLEGERSIRGGKVGMGVVD